MLDLQNVGATWTYPGVTCPFGPDPQAIAACQGGGWAALIGAQGYSTLAEAVLASRPNDTVTICPGVHPDVFTARDITLVAADPTPEATVLDRGAGDYWVVLEDVLLRGVTLGPQRGLKIDNDTSAELECLTVHDHTTLSYPIVQTYGTTGTLTVRHGLFERNRSKVLNANLLIVEDSAFVDNTPTELSGEVVVAAAQLTMKRTAFFGNSQYGLGKTCVDVNAGVNAYASLIEDCWFEGNVNGSTVSGAIVRAIADLTVRGTTFVDNRSAAGVCCLGPANRGADSTTLTVSDSTFRGNESATDVPNSGGGVIYGATQVTLERTRIEDNITSGIQTPFYEVRDERWTGTDLLVQRNLGGDAALWVDYEGHVTCTCCDFGSLGDDNNPADAFLVNQPIDDLPLNFAL